MRQDRYRERPVFSIGVTDGLRHRLSRQLPDALGEPGFGAGHGRRAVHGECRPRERRGADIARTACGIAEPTGRILCIHDGQLGIVLVLKVSQITAQHPPSWPAEYIPYKQYLHQTFIDRIDVSVFAQQA